MVNKLAAARRFRLPLLCHSSSLILVENGEIRALRLGGDWPGVMLALLSRIMTLLRSWCAGHPSRRSTVGVLAEPLPLQAGGTHNVLAEVDSLLAGQFGRLHGFM